MCMKQIDREGSIVARRPVKTTTAWKVIKEYTSKTVRSGPDRTCYKRGKWHEAKTMNYEPLSKVAPRYYIAGSNGFHTLSVRREAERLCKHLKSFRFEAKVVRVEVANLLAKGRGAGYHGTDDMKVATYQFIRYPE